MPSPTRDAVAATALRDFHLCSAVGATVLAVLVTGPLAGQGALAQGLPVLSYALLTILARAALGRGFPHRRFGACNVVTHMRATAVAGLTVALVLPTPPSGGWLVPAVAGCILALDGIDGWLARRFGRASAFGARFDMETDAALALVLAALVWVSGLAGPWVLWLGLARYGFVAAGGVWPWLRAPLPPRLRRKAGCVVQISALVLALVPGMPVPAVQAALPIAAAVLVWSFAADVAWLRRHGRRMATASGGAPVPGQVGSGARATARRAA